MTEERGHSGARGADGSEPGTPSSAVTPSTTPGAGAAAERERLRGERWSRARAALLSGARSATSATRRAALGLWAAATRLWRHERTGRLRARLARGTRGALTFLRAQGPRLRRASLRLLRYGALVAGTALVVLVGGRFALHAVEPGEVGVRYSKWGGGGVSAEDFGSGLHFSLPGVHGWHDVPVGTELMTWRAARALDVRTADGSTVALELSVPFRVRRGSAHKIVTEGNRATYRQLARAKAEPVLLDAFGRLVSEEFSDSARRIEVLALALRELNATLQEIHVEAEEVLVEAVSFSEAYEKKLLQTQRARQRGRVLEALRAQDEEQSIILRRRVEIQEELQERRIALDREIETLTAASKAAAAEAYLGIEKYESDLAADADREYEQLVAQGQTAVLAAQKLERSLRGEILNGAGGSEYLSLQAARSTRLSEVVLNANDPRVPNPLDIDEMLELFRAD